jgi:hypothetical protein
MIVLKFATFKYKNCWKLAISFALTYVYGLVEIYVLKIQTDPMYFMPNGDIQAGILGIDYGLYLFLYILLIVVYINAFYMISDKSSVKGFFARLRKNDAKLNK